MMMYKGKNGITFIDNGTCWRAIGSPNVTDPDVYDYRSRDNRPTGVKYGMGFDTVVGGTRIAFVDYPKEMYTIEELMDGEEYSKIIMHCNVCHAMDQAAQNAGRRSISSLTPPSTPSHRDRVSAGSIVATSLPVLPKYLTAGIKIGKAFGLRPTGDVAVSLGLSFLADLVSGFITDPQYKAAVQSFSDEMADSIDPSVIDRVKQDALDIAEAALKDGDNLLSRKNIIKSMFKNKDDWKSDIAASKAKSVGKQAVDQHQTQPPLFPVQPSGQSGLGIPRLFE